MKRSTKFVLAAIAALGATTVAVPVIAEQAKTQHGAMMGGQDGMMGMMGMMAGAQGSVMATFDTNKDGTISPEEMSAGIQAEIKKYDTDANGSLSLEEFAVMHAAHTKPMTVRAFQMHDADGDGKVTEAEMAAMAAMMQDKMGGQKDDMPGMGEGKTEGN